VLLQQQTAAEGVRGYAAAASWPVCLVALIASLKMLLDFSSGQVVTRPGTTAAVWCSTQLAHGCNCLTLQVPACPDEHMLRGCSYKATGTRSQLQQLAAKLVNQALGSAAFEQDPEIKQWWYLNEQVCAVLPTHTLQRPHNYRRTNTHMDDTVDMAQLLPWLAIAVLQATSCSWSGALCGRVLVTSLHAHLHGLMTAVAAVSSMTACCI
jgi:hypothetical protein